MKIIQMVPQKLIVVNNWIEHMLENQPELQAYFEEFSSQAESNIDSLLNVDTIQKVQSIINSLSVQLFGVLGVVKNIRPIFLEAESFLGRRLDSFYTEYFLTSGQKLLRKKSATQTKCSMDF